MKQIKTYLLLALFIALAVFFVPSFSSTGTVGGAFVEHHPQFPIAEEEKTVIPQKVGDRAEPALTARAVLVKDLNSDLLMLKKNQDTVLPIASLTKMLTALLVYDKTELKGKAQVAAEDLRVAPFVADLKEGEVLTYRDLVEVMLVASANDAAMTLARATSGRVEKFVSEMNELAQELGMESSLFSNPVGFDDPNHYSTANDLTLLIDAFLQVPELREMVSKETTVLSSEKGLVRKFASTNELLSADQRIKGIKTGYTTNSRGSLAVLVEDPDNPYYVVVIGSSDRESEVLQTINWIESVYTWN